MGRKEENIKKAQTLLHQKERIRNIGTALPANRDSSSGKLERCQKEISSPFPVDSHRERTIEIGWIWNKQSSKAWPPIRGSSSPFLRAAYGPTKAETLCGAKTCLRM